MLELGAVRAQSTKPRVVSSNHTPCYTIYSFKITTCRGMEPEFFQQLLLPVLSTLEYCDHQITWSPLTFISLLPRFCSPASLRRVLLALKSAPLEGEHLIQIIELTPHLEELEINGKATSCITPDIMSRLTFKGIEQNLFLLPNLLIFECNEVGDNFDMHTFDALVDMIASRWRKGSKRTSDGCITKGPITALEKLSINFIYESTEDVLRNCETNLDRLRQFSSEGLLVSCTASDEWSDKNHCVCLV